MALCPPSPVLSDCDSLASDELDALLEAQGELSHWPTPPFSEGGKDEFVTLENVMEEELDYTRLTSIFAERCRAGVGDLDTMRMILFRAQLPPEILALSYNIITELQHRSSNCLLSSASGLVLVGALNLAALYSIDHPPKVSEWSNLVCDCRWLAAEIDQMSLQILSALDWRLHSSSSSDAIQSAMERLYCPIKNESFRMIATGHGEVEWAASKAASKAASRSSSKPPPGLKIGCEDGTGLWVNGQLTPEGTPVETMFECVWNPSSTATPRLESV